MTDLDQFRRLLAATEPPSQARIDDATQASSRHARHYIALAAVAIAAALLAASAFRWPAFADSLLHQLSPRQVASLPPAAPGRLTYATPADTPRPTSLAALGRQAGFTPLVPTYLPTGCVRTDQHFESGPGSAIAIDYSCGLTFTEQAGRDDHPVVGTNSSQQLLVDGQPAIYTNGAWVQAVGQDAPSWIPSFAQQLIFDRLGVTVHISAPPDHRTEMQIGGQTVLIGGGMAIMPKDELLRIAASLQPAR